jgi:hypothetical protein
MKKDEFLRELESKLRENRKLGESSLWPEKFKGPLGILGWYFWEIDLIISFFVSVGIFLFWLPEIIKVAKKLLWLS